MKPSQRELRDPELQLEQPEPVVLVPDSGESARWSQLWMVEPTEGQAEVAWRYEPNLGQSSNSPLPARRRCCGWLSGSVRCRLNCR